MKPSYLISQVTFSAKILLLPFLFPCVRRRKNITKNPSLFEHNHSQSSSSSCQIEHPQPNCFNFFNASSENGMASGFVHAKVIKDGSFGQLHVCNYILNHYMKAHDLWHARKLFDEIPYRDVKSWTILISGFSRSGSYGKGLDFFIRMQKEGVKPNQFTFSSVLKCVSGLNELRMGKMIHAWVTRNGINLDVALSNSVTDLYVKCGAFGYAKRFFELMVDKDIVSWNIMMRAYLETGDLEMSLGFFGGLPHKDVSSWNTMIDGLMQNELGGNALELLYQMAKIGPPFNGITFSIALVLFSSSRNLELGRQIHSRLMRVGIYDDGFITCSLIDMYCKCGRMNEASVIFQNLHDAITRTGCSIKYFDESVSWSSMIAGYVQNGMPEDALRIFTSMVCKQIEFDMFTLTSIVTASSNANQLELGQQIHANILKCGHRPDVFLSSSIIDMYAKCGRLNDAWLIFEQTKDRNIVLWTSMVSSFAIHGKAWKAIQLFELMQDEGITPNEVTFLGVLTACRHAGLVEEGCKHFWLMKEAYGIKPCIEHYTCMVALLGQCGRLDETANFIYENNISHLSAVWKVFLFSCQLYKNIGMTMMVSEKLLELEPNEPGPYILLSNSCVVNHRWDEAAKLRKLMVEKGVKKYPGQSWIHLNNVAQASIIGETPSDAAEIILI